MTICNDIDKIAQRAESDFVSIYHFRTYTVLAFTLTKEWLPRCCPNGFTAEVPNTDTKIDGLGLVDLLNEYEDSYIVKLGLQHLVAVFETATFDLMRAILRNFPRHLSSDKKCPVSYIVNANTLEELLLQVIDDELGSLRYKSVRDWFRHYNSFVDISYPDDDTISTITEIKATRDLLVHNDGIINDIYLKRVGTNARGGINDNIIVDIIVDSNYFNQCWEKLRNTVAELARRTNNLYTKH